MMWQREFASHHLRSFDYMLVAIIVFFLIGIITANSIAFLGVGVFTAFLIVFKFYDNGIGKRLELKNGHTAIKLFPKEESTLAFELSNPSIFPIINGEFQFQTGSAIRAYKHVEETDKYWNKITVPLSMFSKRKTIIEIPVVAQERGVSRIMNITYIFPHLFSFDLQTLKFKDIFYTEFIVFPKLLPVQNTEIVFHMIPGEGRSNISPFEDIQSPMGTRDYSYSDPFHRINWNASVKSQQLQTNVYEKIVDMSYVFIVNLGLAKNDHMARFNQNMEDLLSYTAFLSEHAAKKGVPFEIFINSRKPGNVPYIHFSEGEGKNHYGRALEMLARIHKQSMITPFNQMLHRLGKHVSKPKTIIFIGNIPAGTKEVMDSWRVQQQSVFQIVQRDDMAILKPFGKDGLKDAK